LAESGAVFSWGYGGNGRLGHGIEQDEKKPKEIDALKGKGVILLAGGAYHSAAVTGLNFYLWLNRSYRTADGKLLTWGWNYYGQLGYDNGTDILVPTLVAELKDKKVFMISCGEGHTTAVVAS
jgi:alpha-tubulin suppressor-like RCC1 family protein